jgi:hypothetical protein
VDEWMPNPKLITPNTNVAMHMIAPVVTVYCFKPFITLLIIRIKAPQNDMIQARVMTSNNISTDQQSKLVRRSQSLHPWNTVKET